MNKRTQAIQFIVIPSARKKIDLKEVNQKFLDALNGLDYDYDAVVSDCLEEGETRNCAHCGYTITSLDRIKGLKGVYECSQCGHTHTYIDFI